MTIIFKISMLLIVFIISSPQTVEAKSNNKSKKAAAKATAAVTIAETYPLQLIFDPDAPSKGPLARPTVVVHPKAAVSVSDAPVLFSLIKTKGGASLGAKNMMLDEDKAVQADDE